VEFGCYCYCLRAGWGDGDIVAEGWKWGGTFEFSFLSPAGGPVNVEEVALHGAEFFKGVFEGGVGGVGVDVACVGERWGAEGWCC